jgi:hypothetical protein
MISVQLAPHLRLRGAARDCRRHGDWPPSQQSANSLLYGTIMAVVCDYPWQRFSLRTMFLAFTVVAVWLFWNVRIVQNREELWNSLKAQGEVETESVFRKGGPNRWIPYPPSSSHGPRVGLSFIRQALGDKLRDFIVYSGADPALVHATFPEAVIVLPARTESKLPK